MFTSDSHSAANVPVMVYGSNKLISNGETLNNYKISTRIALILGFDESEFPISVNS